MYCYPYAAFGLKTQADGLSPELAAELAHWRAAIIGVAIEEMTHLSLVANLTLRIGGTLHFARQNFPVAAGYHPSGVVVELHPFDPATLDHFIYLERPEGIELADGQSFAATVTGYRRDTWGLLMPSAQNYLTVGHLYRGIREAFDHVALTLGEGNVFVRDARLQVGQDLIGLPGLVAVNDKASALQALSTIIEQGKGSPADSDHSHYQRFLAMRQSDDRLLCENPGFVASRPVARNPVMRRPPFPEGKVGVDHPGAAAEMDLANAIYGALLAPTQGFAAVDPLHKKELLEASIATMGALVPVAEHLTTLPASHHAPSITAALSFAMLRDVAPFPSDKVAIRVIAWRYAELSRGSKNVLAGTAIGERVAQALARIGARLAALVVDDGPVPSAVKKSSSNAEGSAAPTIPPPAAAAASTGAAIALAEGRSVIIEFHTGVRMARPMKKRRRSTSSKVVKTGRWRSAPRWRSTGPRSPSGPPIPGSIL